MKRPIAWLILVVVVLCAAALVYSWRTTHRPAPVTSTPPAPPPASAAAPAIANPVPAPAGAQPLPALNASDGTVHDALDAASGKNALDALLVPDNLVRHIVATIDNLPRSRVAVEMRPVRPAPGQFQVTGSNEQAQLSADNYARYQPYVKLLQNLDAQQFAATYFRLYPLFQQAYRDLGYPNGYFNDRLVQTIDDLLAAPDIKGPIKLVRPNVMYEYADPQLEQRSAGQKLMLRIGPDNAAIVKAKLRELRAVLVSHGKGAGTAITPATGAGAPAGGTSAP